MHYAFMLLTETVGKKLLSSVCVPCPVGVEVSSLAELRQHPPAFPVALKAQVRAGGRGKAGGVRRCADLAEAEAAFQAITGIRFAGELARTVLVEPWLDIAREVYLAVTVDGAAGGYVVLYSPRGGVDVESAAPVRYAVRSLAHYRASEFRALIDPVEPDRSLREKVVALARRALALAESRDCLTVEINPLALLADGSVLATDAKVVADEAAAYRNAYIQRERERELAAEPELVRRADAAGLVLVWLDGDIGLISSGAGLTMAAMDTIDAAGGRPACFLDVSGNPTPRGFAAAFELLDATPQVRAILFSVFGGGMQADRVASTTIDLLEKRSSTKPVVLRLGGTGGDRAAELLAQAGHHNHDSLGAAVCAIVASGEAGG